MPPLNFYNQSRTKASQILFSSVFKLFFLFLEQKQRKMVDKNEKSEMESTPKIFKCNFEVKWPWIPSCLRGSQTRKVIIALVMPHYATYYETKLNTHSKTVIWFIVGIWNLDLSRFWMVKMRLGFKWSRFWVGSEIRKPNHLKWQSFLSKKTFEILIKMSGFWMVLFSNGWDCSNSHS